MDDRERITLLILIGQAVVVCIANVDVLETLHYGESIDYE